MCKAMNHEKLIYLMGHLAHFIEQYVYDVLEDSDEDPQYSAVTAANLIRCYIDVMTQMGSAPDVSDIRSWFEGNLLSGEEFDRFCKKVSEEKESYCGRIFE